MRRSIKIAAVVATFIVVLAVVFAIRMAIMSGRLEAAHRDVATVDLTELADGTYRGEFSDFLVTVKVDVEVTDSRIEAIEIVHQDAGPGYDARETVDRILEAQSPAVEAVTGATGSSRAIMTAVYRALVKTRDE